MDIYREVFDFYDEFGGKKGIIGKTAGGRELPYFFLGSEGGITILSQYALHAREYVTALVCLKKIKDLAKKDLNFGVYFLPLMNPDGVDLCQNGLKNVPKERHKFLLNINGGSGDFSLFKANYNGVDLNVNFDAGWGTGRQNVYFPMPANYIGNAPFCELETAALRDFTYAVKPHITLSYHTKGEEIYWFYGQKVREKKRDLILASSIKKSTGYPLKFSPHSAGGYKDWCIETLGIPSFTIEVGSDDLKHPIGHTYLNALYEKNKSVIENLAESYYKL